MVGYLAKFIVNSPFLWTEMKKRFIKQTLSHTKRMKLISSHFDRKSLVNKGFTVRPKENDLQEQSRKSLVGKIAP